MDVGKKAENLDTGLLSPTRNAKRQTRNLKPET